MLDRIDRTIVAVSSAPGHGPVGIVRFSGPDAIAIAGSLMSVNDGGEVDKAPGSSRVECEVEVAADARVPAFAYLFRAPHSYTRQDIVEIYTVGSPSVLQLVCKRAIQRGALPAMPGEFTARAFLLGAMDLTAAEAVAGVIRAESDAQLRGARRLADGTLNRRIGDVRDQLAELLALVEADIDFAEEPIEFIAPTELKVRLGAIVDGLADLLRRSVSLERLDAMPHVLLVGPPNVGKSSLMNRLSGTNRAICSAVAGTTRDLLSAPVRFGRVEAILLDSAGVDDSANEIIAAARAMTLAAAGQVDVACLVMDAAAEDAPWSVLTMPAGAIRLVVVLNKSDLIDETQCRKHVDAARMQFAAPVCAVSALTGAGIEELRHTLAGCLGDAPTTVGQEAILASERQQGAVTTAAASIAAAAQLAAGATETSDCADLLAFELREALDQLGMVTGEVTTDELLGRVFSRFCIGK